jgi:DNA-directed RNA polymerase subunit RPC12/RpoP
MTDPHQSRNEWHPNGRRRRCPRCRGFSRLTHSILDSRHGNVVRLYHCAACGEHLWDDGSKFLAEAATGISAGGE